jgi:NADP-dependent 3-hydroxy acid dehydrogenase YdfG
VRAVGAYGHLEVIFNNAAIMPLGTILTTSLETWERVMAVNLRSVFARMGSRTKCIWNCGRREVLGKSHPLIASRWCIP